MPKTVITYRIFIASPSDVNEERSVVRSVAEELNNSHSLKNIRLEVIGWENSTYPAMGNDAQDVINNQINDDYDIFLGIFWTRFGTPTQRDTSGTKEEFERAYNRYKADPKSVHILMYFKNAAIPIFDIDALQITKVQEFYTDITNNRGGLVSKFAQTSEFEKLVRLHLSKLLNDISNNFEQTVINKEVLIPVVIKSDVNERDEEAGYLEYISLSVKLMAKATPELERLGKQISDLGNRVAKRAEAINALQGKTPDVVTRETRKTIDLSSNDLNIFNKNVPPIINSLNDYFNGALSNLNKAILIHKSYMNNQDELNEAMYGLKNLKENIFYSNNELYQLTSAIKAIPPLTTKFTKSKNEAVSILTDISAQFESYINLLDNSIDIIDN